MTFDPVLNNRLKFYERYGEYRIDSPFSNIVYEGWAPLGSSESSNRWHIRRKSLLGTVWTTSSVTEGQFDKSWIDRSSYFGAIPWNISLSTNSDGLNDFINLGDNLNKERTDAFSWSFWIRPRIVTSQQTWYSKRSSSGVGIEYKMLSNGRPDFTIQGTANLLRVQYASSLQPLTWQHIVFTYSGNSLASGCVFYLNSSIYALTTVTNTLASSILVPDDAKFGSYNSGNYFDGNACDFRFFNRVLTSAEVVELYNGGHPKDPGTFSDVAALTNNWRGGTNDTFPIWTDEAGSVDGTMVNMTEGDFEAVYP